MIRYRTFLNTDAPALVPLWNRQSGRRPLMLPLTLTLLEECVFGKPFFDRRGFLVAEVDGGVAGFAHAGLGVSADGSGLSTEAGAVYLVVVGEAPPARSHCPRIAGASGSVPDRPRRPHFVGRLRPARARFLSRLVRR